MFQSPGFPNIHGSGSHHGRLLVRSLSSIFSIFVMFRNTGSLVIYNRTAPLKTGSQTVDHCGARLSKGPSP